jgi:hypothetical protein
MTSINYASTMSIELDKGRSYAFCKGRKWLKMLSIWIALKKNQKRRKQIHGLGCIENHPS